MNIPLSRRLIIMVSITLFITFSLLGLLYFYRIKYSIKEDSLKQKTCEIEKISWREKLSGPCADYFSDNKLYKPALSQNPQIFETVNDNKLGYTLVKPAYFYPYGYNYNGERTNKYQISSADWNYGRYDYNIVRIFKSKEQSFQNAIKALINEDIKFLDLSNEPYKSFVKAFPPDYQIELPYGDGISYFIDKRNQENPTRFYIFNPEFPDRFYMFDIGIGLRGLENRNGEIYLPNGLLWQNSFRIVEGEGEFESINKSIGKPNGVDYSVIKPVKTYFVVRDMEYYFYTPGDDESGYNFNLTLFDTDSQGAKKDIEPLYFAGTIDEVRDHIKPKVVDISSPSCLSCLTSTNRELKLYTTVNDKLDGKEFISTVSNFWFSKDLRDYVLVDEPREESGEQNIKLTFYRYKMHDYYKNRPYKLEAKKEIFIKRPSNMFQGDGDISITESSGIPMLELFSYPNRTGCATKRINLEFEKLDYTNIIVQDNCGVSFE